MNLVIQIPYELAFLQGVFQYHHMGDFPSHLFSHAKKKDNTVNLVLHYYNIIGANPWFFILLKVWTSLVSHPTSTIKTSDWFV